MKYVSVLFNPQSFEEYTQMISVPFKNKEHQIQQTTMPNLMILFKSAQRIIVPVFSRKGPVLSLAGLRKGFDLSSASAVIHTKSPA